MPTVFHPRALDAVTGQPPGSVTVGGDSHAVDENGRVELPNDGAVSDLAQAYGLNPNELAPEFNDTDDDGSTCPYCDEYDGEHVEQHVAQAHPEEN